jgi:hypothetical protein
MSALTNKTYNPTTNDDRYCCKHHCENACITAANRIDRLQRMKRAAKRQEAILLKSEKSRLLRSLEQNKRRRNVLHAENGILDSVVSAINMPGKMNSTLDSVKATFDQLLKMASKVTVLFDFPADFDLQGFLINSYGLLNSMIRKDMLSASLMFYALCRNLKIDFSIILATLSQFAQKPSPLGLCAESLFTLLQTESALIGFGNIVVTLFSLMSAGSAFTYVGAMKNLADFGRAAIGFTKVTEFTSYLFRYAKNLYFQNVLGKTLEQVEFEQSFPGLKTILERVELIKSEEFQLKFLDTNRSLCNDVVALENDIETLRFEAMRARRSELSIFLTGKVQTMTKVFEAARNSPAHAFAARPAPTTLWVYGLAGTGKSNLVNYFKTRIYANRYADVDEWNVQNFSLTRCAENEYWDGYHNQPVILYDDMCQSKDSPSKPNPEIMEFIRAKNEAPYHLHMSAIADKKNVYFNSEYVIATSNVKHPSPTSIADASAFQRRWDISIEVTVNDAFRDTSKDGTNAIKHGIDPLKVAAHIKKEECGSFIKDLYSVLVYDMRTKETIQGKMSLDEFETYYDTVSAEKLSQASQLNQSILELTGVTSSDEKVDASAFMTKFSAEAEDEFIDAEDVTPAPPEVPTDETTTMVDSLFQAIEADIAPPEIVDINKPWLNINVPSNIYERSRSFLTRLMRKTYAIWTEFEHEYAIILNLKNVFNRVLLTPAQTVFVSLYNFLCSKTTLIVAFMTICVSVATRLLLRYFIQRSCRLLAATCFPTLCCSEKCRSACKFCDTIIVVETIGTFSYGMFILDRIMLECPERLSQYVLWRTENLPKYKEELTLRVLKDNASLNERIANVTESRETLTRPSPPALRVESREMMTRGSRIRNNRESREIMTRGPIANLRVESEVAVVNIYDVDGPLHQLRAEKQDLVMLEQWESVCSKNAVFCSGNGTVSGTFITGRTLMLPMHFVDGIDKTFSYMNPGQDVGTTVPISLCSITQATTLLGKKVDMALVTIPTSPSRKNIISLFSTANDLSKTPEGDFAITTLRKLNNNICMTNFYGGALKSTGTQTYMDGDNVRTITQSFAYDVDTRPGDCGGLLFARNNLIGGKIIGMHIAGNRGVGIAIPLSREFIQRNLDVHVSTHSLGINAIVDARYPFEAEMKRPTVNYDVVVPNSLINKGSCISLGIATAPFAATATNICHSLLKGVIKEPDTKPAHLRSVLVDGERIDPMIRGVAKVLNSPNPLDPELLTMCIADVEWIHAKNGPLGRVYTYEEAIVGVEDNSYATPLNRTSSPGYPYCLDNGEPGKRKWFGYDSYVINDDILTDVNELLDYARQGKRGDVVWLATLKDERRPIEKVDAIKTRVFAAGPMHYTIAVRMYFLDFVTHVMKNRIDNEVGVGTNPYSIDWHRTAERLTSKGTDVIAGDFSNYDGSLLQDVMWEILDMINNWYDDGPENKQIRSVLFEEICNARVMVKGEIVQWTHSQPSGNPLTVIINSLFNQIIMRYSYLLCKKTAGLPLLCDFTKDVSMQTYGDDNVLNISHFAIEWYNQITITHELAKIGLTYTDEGKTGQLIRSRALSDVSYLKRKFQLDSCGYYSCPLDIGVCYEMANWIRGKSGRGIAATMENGNASLRELYFHGPAVFNHARAIYSKAMIKHNPQTRFPSFAELREEYTNAYYC